MTRPSPISPFLPHLLLYLPLACRSSAGGMESSSSWRFSPLTSGHWRKGSVCSWAGAWSIPAATSSSRSRLRLRPSRLPPRVQGRAGAGGFPIRAVSTIFDGQVANLFDATFRNVSKDLLCYAGRGCQALPAIFSRSPETAIPDGCRNGACMALAKTIEHFRPATAARA